MPFELVLSHGMMLYHRNLLWSIQRCCEEARRAGYSGIQFHPTRWGMAELSRIRSPWRAIRSVHESVRDERTLLDCLVQRNPGHRLNCFIVFAQQWESFPSLLKIQFGEGERTVTFSTDGIKAMELLPGSGCVGLVQPCIKVFRAWNIHTVPELIAKLEEFGAWLCLDTHHWRADEEDERLPHWRQAWPQLLPYVREVHVCAGRDDVTSSNRVENTASELQDLLGIGPKTELREMLRWIAASGWRGPVVAEIPATAIARIYCDSHPLLTPPGKVMEGFGVISRSMKNIFGM